MVGSQAVLAALAQQLWAALTWNKHIRWMGLGWEATGSPGSLQAKVRHTGRQVCLLMEVTGVRGLQLVLLAAWRDTGRRLGRW